MAVAKSLSPGVIVFTVASAWCGLATNIQQLDSIQGAPGNWWGHCLFQAAWLGQRQFSPSERGRAIGTWSGFTSITAAIGPVLGGWFTPVRFVEVGVLYQCSAWPNGRVAGPMESPGKHSRASKPAVRLGGQGLLAALGFGGIVFALIESVPLVGIAGGIVLMAMLCIGKHDHPRQWFRSACSVPAISVEPTCSLFFLYAALSGVLFLFPSRFDPGARLFPD